MKLNDWRYELRKFSDKNKKIVVSRNEFMFVSLRWFRMFLIRIEVKVF